MGIVTDLVYIILAALVGGFLALMMRQPLIIGYIFAGILVGPYTLGPTVEQTSDIRMLAEVGVALLLFTLGLEFSFGELRRLFGLTIVGAPIQILLSGLVVYLFSTFVGYSSSDAMWIGAAIGLSSTMVVLKILTARDGLQTTVGRIMLAILVAQDLAVIPILLILPQLTGETINYSSLLAAAAKSLLFLLSMFVAGTRFFPWLFRRISQLGSRELLFLTTLSVALGAGFLSHELGLSFALGAFVAGMLLSETDFSRQALSDVAGLRDLFSLIFFVSVGMLFDPRFFLDNLGVIFLFATLIVATKAVVIGVVTRGFGYSGDISLGVGLGLAQIGEFAFVIATAGLAVGHLSADAYSLMIAATVVSMVATPALFWLADTLSAHRARAASALHDLPSSTTSNDHVILIGGGVVGRYIAQVLGALEKPYIVIESDYRAVMASRDLGITVLFGDASHRIILDAAGIQRARLVVITITHNANVISVLDTLRSISPNVPIVVRVSEIEATDQLSTYKPHEIVQPQLEAGLELVRQSLLAFGMGEAEIFPVLAQLRQQRYNPVNQSKEQKSDVERGMRAARFLQLMWVDITDTCPLVGRTIRELRLREVFGVSVVAMIRGGECTPNPGPDESLRHADVVGVLGSQHQLQQFRESITGASHH